MDIVILMSEASIWLATFWVAVMIALYLIRNH